MITFWTLKDSSEVTSNIYAQDLKYDNKTYLLVSNFLNEDVDPLNPANVFKAFNMCKEQGWDFQVLLNKWFPLL